MSTVITTQRLITIFESLPQESAAQLFDFARFLETTYSSKLKMEAVESTPNEYDKAKAMALLETGFDLGTYGEASWTRDELHERGDVQVKNPFV